MLNETDQTFAKQHMGIKQDKTKMMGLYQKKEKDLLAVEIRSEIKKLTKRTILQKLTLIYDPLGIIPPITIIGKVVH